MYSCTLRTLTQFLHILNIFSSSFASTSNRFRIAQTVCRLSTHTRTHTLSLMFANLLLQLFRSKRLARALCSLCLDPAGLTMCCVVSPPNSAAAAVGTVTSAALGGPLVSCPQPVRVGRDAAPGGPDL